MSCKNSLSLLTKAIRDRAKRCKRVAKKHKMRGIRRLLSLPFGHRIEPRYMREGTLPSLPKKSCPRGSFCFGKRGIRTLDTLTGIRP